MKAKYYIIIVFLVIAIFVAGSLIVDALGGVGGGKKKKIPTKSASFCHEGSSKPSSTECMTEFKEDYNPCGPDEKLSDESFCWTTGTQCATAGGKTGYICSCNYDCVKK